MRYFLLLAPFLTLLACENETAAPVDFSGDLAYFPLVLDRPVFFDQDSIVLRATTRGTAYDTARAQVRETLVEQYVGADGQEIYRGERWQRANDAAPWRFVQSYTQSRTDRTAQRSEDNLSFTKLVFPIRADRRWDGNAAFDERTEVAVGGEFLDVYNYWDYRYTDSPLDTTYNGVAVQGVRTVRQAEENNSIEYRRAYERYAPGIGLVERFLDARHTQCVACCQRDFGQCNELPWGEKAEKGFILHQRLRALPE